MHTHVPVGLHSPTKVDAVTARRDHDTQHDHHSDTVRLHATPNAHTACTVRTLLSTSVCALRQDRFSRFTHLKETVLVQKAAVREHLLEPQYDHIPYRTMW